LTDADLTWRLLELFPRGEPNIAVVLKIREQRLSPLVQRVSTRGEFVEIIVQHQELSRISFPEKNPGTSWRPNPSPDTD
jgi:hypothetical protein